MLPHVLKFSAIAGRVNSIRSDDIYSIVDRLNRAYARIRAVMHFLQIRGHVADVGSDRDVQIIGCFAGGAA